MAIRFQDKHTCSRCEHTYDWWCTIPDENGMVFGRWDNLIKNVKDYTKLIEKGHYSIKLECPECGRRDFVEKNVYEDA